MQTCIKNAITFMNNAEIILKLIKLKILNAYFLKFCFFIERLTYVSNNTKLKLNI